MLSQKIKSRKLLFSGPYVNDSRNDWSSEGENSGESKGEALL